MLEKKNDYHVAAFLNNPKNAIDEPMQYMMLKNGIFYDCTQTNLLEYHLSLIEQNDNSDPYNLGNLLYLFEEISCYSEEQLSQNDYIEDFVSKLLNEKSVPFNGIDELTLPRKHFIAGLVIIYWRVPVKLNSITFFKVLWDIMNKSVVEDSFVLNTSKMFDFNDLYELPNDYNNRHQIDFPDDHMFNFQEKYLANFYYIFLFAAIKTEQKLVLDLIFKCENFLIICPQFPLNMKPKEIHFYCLNLFLENKYELGRDDLPRSWITSETMEKYLNNQLSETSKYYYINPKFMLPYYNYNPNLMEETDDLVINEDYDTLSFILNNFNLKKLLIHPVLEVIIELKSRKYNRIMTHNLLAILLFCLIPAFFISYMFHWTNLTQSNLKNLHYFKNMSYGLMEISWLFDEISNNYNFTLIYTSLFIQFLYIITKEYFNYLISPSTYRQRTEVIDYIMILVPIILFILTALQQIFCVNINFILIMAFEIINYISILTVIYNLSNISNLWKSNEMQLVEKAKNYIKYASLIRIFFACSNNRIDEKLLLWLIVKLLNECVGLHRLRSLYIEKETNAVYTTDEKLNLVKLPIKLSKNYTDRCFYIVRK